MSNQFSRPAKALLDQYLYAKNELSRKAGADLFRQEHWHIANTMRGVALNNGEQHYVDAIDIIMCGAIIKDRWPVTDCSGGKIHLVGEYFRQKVCKEAK